jgi:molybdopterin synthase catalytic subunit
VTFLSTTPIDSAALAARVDSSSYGAVATFLGQVRNHHGGRAVQRLEYSAYGPMAEQECARVVAEAEARWPVHVALAHRIGTLGIGDVAVAVAAGGAHRDEAFAACRYVVEEVKRRVPIWKKEFYQNGAVEWVNPTSEAAGQTGVADVLAGKSPTQGQAS